MHHRATAALIAMAFVCACADGGHTNAGTGSPASSGCTMLSELDPSLAAAIDPIIDAAVAEGFAGQIAIARGGAFVYRRNAGSADLAGAVPITDATLFQLSSMTKYFTAVMTLKAVEEGRLGLGDPVRPLLGGATVATPQTTIADLLSHQSGLGSSYAAETAADSGAAVAAIAAEPFDAARAHAFHYSNDGYDLLAVILERLYGQRYEDIARTKIVAPACLDHVGFWGEVDHHDPQVRAQPLTAENDRIQARNYGMIGSAGFLATAADLVSFQHALNAGAVLQPSMLAELRAPRAAASIGQVLFGSFLVDRPGLGRTIGARGAEDWGDNAYLNDYIDCGFTLAIVTSRGPAENSGRPLFRDSITPEIERVLAPRCTPN